MTAAPAAPLYVRDGSRFVVYDEQRQHTPPIPVPRPAGPGEPSAEQPVVEVAPGRYVCWAPRCPHGHFERWALQNCRRCARGR